MTGIAKDMDTYTVRLPLGVTAGITPFNFPAMIPLWVGSIVTPPLSHIQTSMNMKTCEIIVAKGEIAHHEQFLISLK